MCSFPLPPPLSLPKPPLLSSSAALYVLFCLVTSPKSTLCTGTQKKNKNRNERDGVLPLPSDCTDTHFFARPPWFHVFLFCCCCRSSFDCCLCSVQPLFPLFVTCFGPAFLSFTCVTVEVFPRTRESEGGNVKVYLKKKERGDEHVHFFCFAHEKRGGETEKKKILPVSYLFMRGV